MDDRNRAKVPPPDPNGRMSDQFIADALAKSGRQTPPLRAAARANILNAMLAENARLLAIETRVKTQPAPTPSATFWDRLVRLFNPPVARTFGGAAAILLVAVSFVLLGGERGTALGTVTGGGMLQESRTAFGWTWAIGRSVGDQGLTLHGGDELTTQITTTIVLTNQSTIAVAPGTRIVMAQDGSGVADIQGEAAFDIHHAPNEIPNFTVRAGDAQMIDRGTRFRTRRSGVQVVHYTDFGRVSVVAGSNTKDVITGEQIRAVGPNLMSVELQTPVVRLGSASNNRALTNREAITMTAVIYPKSTLYTLNADTGNTLYTFTADAAGNVTGVLELGGEDEYRYSFFVVAPQTDGRRSQASDPVTIVVDRTAPRVTLNPVTQDATEVVVRGSTELRSTVVANGVPATVNADGSFEVRLPKLADLKIVRLIVTDEAGNPRAVEIKVQ